MSATVFYDHATAELATLTNTFSVTTAGVSNPTDPTTVSLTVTTPSGVATTYTYGATITKTSTGLYTKDVACTEPGEWIAVWVGTGTASDVQVVRWTVFDTATVLYASPENLKSRLGITNTNDDLEIREACEAVSEWIDDVCEDFFGRSTRTQTFETPNRYELSIPSLVSVTTLKTDDDADGVFETTWTANTDYQLLPYDPDTGRYTKPYTKVKAIGSHMFPLSVSLMGRRNRVEIAGVWGWPQVPSGVRSAALAIAADTFKLKDAPFDVAGFDTFGPVRIRKGSSAEKFFDTRRKYPSMIA